MDDDRSREISSDDPQFVTVDEDDGGEEELMGAKMRGTYTDYKNMMIAKHKNYGRSTEGNAIIIDSYDDTIYFNTDKKEINIVSYSSQLLTSSTVSVSAKLASSWNILTWMKSIREGEMSKYIPCDTASM